MIDRILLVVMMLVFASPSYSSWFGGQQKQMVAPKSVQEIVIDKKKARCDQKLKEYNELVQENSDSEYYRYLLDNWKRDCQ